MIADPLSEMNLSYVGSNPFSNAASLIIRMRGIMTDVLSVIPIDIPPRMMLFSCVMMVANTIVHLFVWWNVPSIPINFGEYLMAAIAGSVTVTLVTPAFVASMSYLTPGLQLESART